MMDELLTAAPFRATTFANDAGYDELAFWLHHDTVVAAMNCNVWDVTEDLQALVPSGATPSPDRLRDPDIPLATLSEPDPASR